MSIFNIPHTVKNCTFLHFSSKKKKKTHIFTLLIRKFLYEFIFQNSNTWKQGRKKGKRYEKNRKESRGIEKMPFLQIVLQKLHSRVYLTNLKNVTEQYSNQNRIFLFLDKSGFSLCSECMSLRNTKYRTHSIRPTSRINRLLEQND